MQALNVLEKSLNLTLPHMYEPALKAAAPGIPTWEHLKNHYVQSWSHFQHFKIKQKQLSLKAHRPDAIRQRDANFEFSKTNKTVNG
jgi:hypothetical protein